MIMNDFLGFIRKILVVALFFSGACLPMVSAEPLPGAGSPPVGVEVEVTLSNGDAHRGFLRQWDKSGLRLETEMGEMNFKVENVESVVPRGQAAAPEDVPLEKPAVRGPRSPLFLELYLLFGVGMRGTSVARTTDGEKVRISAGGGLGGLVSAGYELSPKMDALLSVGFQESSLVPRLSNGSASFKRSMLLLTARRKFHFGDGLLRLGAGGGLYQGGRLHVELTDLGDSDYDMRYTNAFGGHVGLDFEAPLGRRVALCFGVKYSRVTYRIKSLSIDGSPVPPRFILYDFQRFRGAAIDLLAGFRF